MLILSNFGVGVETGLELQLSKNEMVVLVKIRISERLQISPVLYIIGCFLMTYHCLPVGASIKAKSA